MCEINYSQKHKKDIVSNTTDLVRNVFSRKFIKDEEIKIINLRNAQYENPLRNRRIYKISNSYIKISSMKQNHHHSHDTKQILNRPI